MFEPLSQVCSVLSLSQLSGIEKVGTLVCLPLVPLLRPGVLQAHLKARLCVCVCELCDTPRDWPSVFVDRMDQNVTITFDFLTLHLITHPFAVIKKTIFILLTCFDPLT